MGLLINTVGPISGAIESGPVPVTVTIASKTGVTVPLKSIVIETLRWSGPTVGVWGEVPKLTVYGLTVCVSYRNILPFAWAKGADRSNRQISVTVRVTGMIDDRGKERKFGHVWGRRYLRMVTINVL